MAADVKALLDELKVEGPTIIAMGGGEAAKYFTNYGNSHLSRLVLISCVVPYMLQTSDDPDGVPKEVFGQINDAIKNDRPGFLENFAKEFYGVTMINHPVSSAFLANNLTKAMEASPIATLECANSFAFTDFE